MSNLPAPQDENSELQTTQIEVAKGYYLTPKYKLWEQYYLDRSNKETFGNATISACKAYDLDPTDPKAYNIASAMGSKNKRKVKDLRKKYWEARGWTDGKLYDLYGKKAAENLDLDLLNTIAQDLGVQLPEYKPYLPNKGVTNNTQINANDVQISFTSTEDKQ